MPIDNNGQLESTGEWRRNFDLEAWAAEVRELEQRLKYSQSEEDDVSHLKKIVNWATVSWIIGCIAAPFNPIISSIGLSTAIMARWTMIGHHVVHGGYNRQ